MKFSSYPSAIAIQDADTFLIHQSASNSEKQVTAAVLAQAVQNFGSVTSIADLKAVDVSLIPNGKQVQVAGYYLAADGGGGNFYYDSGSVLADNGGTVIAPNAGSGKWLRVVSPVLNVRHFGAKGDGVTNDFAAINAAIQAAVAGNTVLFPNSSAGYVLSSPVTVASDQITIKGEGNARVITLNENNFRFFLVTSLFRVVFDGITFNGGYLGTTTGLGQGCIEFSGTSRDCVVKNCYFTRVAKSGVYVVGACSKISITNCGFNQCFCGVFSDDDTIVQPTKLTISNNSFTSGIGTTGTAFSGAIKISGIGTDNTDVGHVISGNTITSPGQMGIEIQGDVNGVCISSNTVYGAGFGISVSGCLRASVDGNTIKSCLSYGVEIASGSARCSVAANAIDMADTSGASFGAHCIEVSTSTDVDVSANTLVGSNSNGCHVVDSNTVSIVGNTFRCIAGASINIQNSYSIGITNNLVTAPTNAVTYGVVIDVSATSGIYHGFIISNNIFKEQFGFAIIRLLSTSGSATIDAATITHNDTSRGSSVGAALDFVFGGSTSIVTNFTCKDNFGPSGPSSASLSYPAAKVSSGGIVGAGSLNCEVILVDASGGNISITLPDPTKHYGFTVCVKKVDATGNTVTLTPAAGTIDGSATKVLSAQYKYITIRSDSTAYYIIANN